MSETILILNTIFTVTAGTFSIVIYVVQRRTDRHVKSLHEKHDRHASRNVAG